MATTHMQLQQQLLSHPKLHCLLLQNLSQISRRLHSTLLLGLMHMLLMMCQLHQHLTELLIGSPRYCMKWDLVY